MKIKLDENHLFSLTLPFTNQGYTFTYSCFNSQNKQVGNDIIFQNSFTKNYCG